MAETAIILGAIGLGCSGMMAGNILYTRWEQYRKQKIVSALQAQIATYHQHTLHAKDQEDSKLFVLMTLNPLLLILARTNDVMRLAYHHINRLESAPAETLLACPYSVRGHLHPVTTDMELQAPVKFYGRPFYQLFGADATYVPQPADSELLWLSPDLFITFENQGSSFTVRYSNTPVGEAAHKKLLNQISYVGGTLTDPNNVPHRFRNFATQKLDDDCPALPPPAPPAESFAVAVYVPPPPLPKSFVERLLESWALDLENILKALLKLKPKIKPSTTEPIPSTTSLASTTNPSASRVPSLSTPRRSTSPSKYSCKPTPPPVIGDTSPRSKYKPYYRSCSPPQPQSRNGRSTSACVVLLASPSLHGRCLESEQPVSQ